MENNIKLFYFCIIVLILLNTSFKWPVERGRITSTFGESRGDHLHDGVDIISPDNRVYPVADGRLIYFWDRSIFPTENYPGGGNYIVIEHSKGIYSLYMHLSDGFNIRDSYSESDLLGIIGNTGHSFGKHLHFSFLKISDRMSINPFLYLPEYQDNSKPTISEICIKVSDRYFVINENSNIRLTQHYPLLINISDSITGKEKLGIYKLLVIMNNKKVIEVDFSQIGFSKKGLTISDYTFQDLFDVKGYYKVKNVSYINGNNKIKITASDYFGNISIKEIVFNVKLEI